MPHSLRVRLKNLQRKGELTEKDIDRIFKALSQEPCDDESRTELEQALDSLHVEQERIEILRIFAEVEDFDFIREMSSEQLWKLILIASMVLDVGKEKRDKE